MEGDCSQQISLNFQQSAAILAFLRQKKVSAHHSLSLVSMTLPSHVRFSSEVISWTRSSLRKLDSLWMKVYKMACGVSSSMASCIMRFPTALGGRNLSTPLTAVCETVWNLLESCCFELGGLRELLFMEYNKALHSWNCNNLEELQRAIALSNLLVVGLAPATLEFWV